MRHSIRTFIRNEEGLETIEYAMMTSLIVAGMLVSLVALGIAVEGRFNIASSVIAAN